MAVALGPDDATLAFNDAFLINLANLETGQITNRIDGHSWVLLNLVYSRDGKQLVSEDNDKLVVWEVAGMSQQACFLGEHIVGFSFDDARLLTITQESLLASDAETYESTVIAGPCKLARISQNGTTLVWVNSKSILHVWDLKSNRELLQHTLLSPPKSLKFADTEELLGCVTADGELLILNLLKRRVRLIPNDADFPIVDFAFSHDARHVAVIQEQKRGGNSPRLSVFEVVSGRNLLQVRTTNCCYVTMLPDGNTVVTGHWDGSIKVWPVGT